ncbi:MAG TPA: four helix bundle protein [Abditibacterium sp.]
MTEDDQFARDFGLRDQLRRAAVSVPSNIAEGDERDGDGESVYFFRVAKGSLAEVRTQLEIASAIGYFPNRLFLELDDECAKSLAFSAP